MKIQGRWRGSLRRAVLAVLTAAMLLALTQVLVTCGSSDSSSGGLIWDQGNWDQQNWQ